MEKEKVMNTNRFLKIFAIITVIGAYVMIVLGVLVSTTGSGQGCGNSWPFCHGEIIPGSLTVKGLTEYSHRIMSSVDGFLVLILTVWAWFAYRKRSPHQTLRVSEPVLYRRAGSVRRGYSGL